MSRLSQVFIFIFITTFIACSDNKQQDLVHQESSDPKIAKLKMPEGFAAERLYSPGENEQGSWVSMTFDNKGRLIACDQFGSLYRMQVPATGDSSKPKAEKLNVDLGYAQGLLYAFNSLWVSVNHDGEGDLKKKGGLYRLRDLDGDDQYESVEHLKEMNGSGEHGPHSLILSPDKNSIYMVAGNFTDIPKFDTYKNPSNWKEDNLFPLITDPSGHAADRHAPGGWIAHIDSSGKKWELVSSGYRNTYDIAFNDAGDLFAYDSDMEYDFGMPWYKPTRICHVTDGAEFGWRTGSINWSPAFPDALPAVLNIGQGSPTNLVYGGNAKFPEKYKKSLFAFDWSFGIIYAIEVEPDGASYKAKAEEFISGAPLPLTDGIIGPDGALYFLTGGRRLDSDLYRITYNGKENTETVKATPITEENKLRRQLEEYHVPKQGAVDIAWPQLRNNDRFIRYAARIALEHQPVAQWQDKVFAEKDPVTLIQSAVALARQGKPDAKNKLIGLLNGIDAGSLSAAQKVDLSRAYELVFLRMGMPEGSLKEQTITVLDKQYPANDNMVNRQYSKLLIRLQAPDAVKKTMALMDDAKDDTSYQRTFTQSSDLILRNPQYGLDIAEMLSKVPPAQQTYYAVMLSAAKTGWTPELQQKYFTWFKNASNYRGGKSFMGFINASRKLALANVPKADFAKFNTMSGDSIFMYAGPFVPRQGPQPKGPGRDWKLDEAVKVVDSGLANRNFENGLAMYNASMCSTCHSMRGEGGQIGPDLTQLGTRFSTADMLQAIIEPSKTISDQYAATTFYLKDGKSIVGRLISKDDKKYSISQNPFAPETLREIPVGDVLRTKLSDISIMMPGMINNLNSEELKDLMAFLMAGGNKENDVYKKK